MANFKQVAQAATIISPLMEGKTKISFEDLQKRFGGIVTVTAFDFVKGEAKSGEAEYYPVINFAEDKDAFFYGGAVLAKICTDWADMYGGSAELASADLSDEGGVKMRLYKAVTKRGNTLVKIEII